MPHAVHAKDRLLQERSSMTTAESAHVLHSLAVSNLNSALLATEQIHTLDHS